MEDGRASRQVRQENAARDWALRLSKMPQTIPRSAQQKEDLNSQDRLLLRKIQRDQSKVSVFKDRRLQFHLLTPIFSIFKS
jgi:hypothetical protein